MAEVKPKTSLLAAMQTPLFRRAVIESVLKLDPRHQARNPVMFVVLIGSLLCTALSIMAALGSGEAPTSFIVSITLWLWFTLLFANFAEALAEGRGKAQAASLRSAKRDVQARKLSEARRDAASTSVAASTLRKGDVVLVEAGETVPGDGTVIEGIASVDESAITGESAPVIRESGGDRYGRDQSALGLAVGAHHRQPRRELP
jgi:K+-transporting ATPase ATPase B chain